MGKDKAQIPWGRGTLLSHAVDQMRQVAADVFIVGGTQTGAGLPAVLPDGFAGRGPLAGIHAALVHTSTEWNFFLALDMPLVSAELLSFIAGNIRKGAALAVIPKMGPVLQPLCGAYTRNLHAEVLRALQDGKLSIHRLLEHVNTRIIEETELIAAGFSPEMLLNVNTPDDLERAKFLAKSLYVE